MRFPKPNMEFSYLPSVGYESFLESISHKENSRVSWNIQSILFTIRCICGQIVVRNTDIRFASIYLATRWSFSGMTLNLKGTPVGTYCIGVYSCLIGSNCDSQGTAGPCFCVDPNLNRYSTKTKLRHSGLLEFRPDLFSHQYMIHYTYMIKLNTKVLTIY
jgi:hypothetical protein